MPKTVYIKVIAFIYDKVTGTVGMSKNVASIVHVLRVNFSFS